MEQQLLELIPLTRIRMLVFIKDRALFVRTSRVAEESEEGTARP